MSTTLRFLRKLVGTAAAVTLAFGSISAYAAEMEEIVVKGSLGSLPGENVDAIFGFNKSILNTPRSASTIGEGVIVRNSIRVAVINIKAQQRPQ